MTQAEQHLKPVSNRILDALTVGPVTSAGIAKTVGLNPKSASSILCKLYEAGVVTRERIEPTGIGRPSYLYQVAS